MILNTNYHDTKSPPFKVKVTLTFSNDCSPACGLVFLFTLNMAMVEMVAGLNHLSANQLAAEKVCQTSGTCVLFFESRKYICWEQRRTGFAFHDTMGLKHQLVLRPLGYGKPNINQNLKEKIKGHHGFLRNSCVKYKLCRS